MDGGRYPAKVTALVLVDVMRFEGGVLPARRGTPQLYARRGLLATVPSAGDLYQFL